jgi:hypothetical protein
MKRNHCRSSDLGLGVAGGLAGAAVMAALQYAMRSWLRRKCSRTGRPDAGIGFQALFRQPDPASLAASRVCSRADKSRLGSAAIVHAGFSILGGLAYFRLRAPFHDAPSLFAFRFGFALWMGATEIALPAFALSRTPRASSLSVQLFGLGAHVAYALTAERVFQLRQRFQARLH